MLVVDINALHPVNFLDLINQIVLNCMDTLYGKNIMRVNRAFCQSVTCLNFIAFLDNNTRAIREQIRLALTCLCIGDDCMVTLFNFFKGNCSGYFTDNRKVFWFTSFKKLFYTGKALCNIFGIGHTAGVECAHGKLCARFTNGLRSNNANSLTDFHGLSGREVLTIALPANTMFGAAV